jgi:hypothetical protein
VGGLIMSEWLIEKMHEQAVIQTKKINKLEEALRYVVKCNDEAMPDPNNQQWMGSPCREQCVEALENK